MSPSGGDGALLLPPSVQEPSSKMTVAGTSQHGFFMASDYISDALKPRKHRESIQADLWEVGFPAPPQPPAKRALRPLGVSCQHGLKLKKNKQKNPPQTASIGSALKCGPGYLPHLICLIVSNESTRLLH